jgi:hypothetical protein
MWALRWREHSTCGWLDDGNSTGDDTRVWSKGGFGGESPDRWVLVVNDGRAEVGGRLGSHAKGGRGGVEAGRHGGKWSAKLFPFWNSFPI